MHISARNDTLKISGDDEPVAKASHVLNHLASGSHKGQSLDRQQLLDLIATTHRNPAPTAGSGERSTFSPDNLDVYLTGRRVRAMTDGQKQYLEAIAASDLTFCCGPAGTGKTYLAVAAAVSMLKRSIVRKIVLVRPAVEAGEKLGFLPGSMQDKINPYLRPLLDGLHDMMNFDQVQRLVACDVIEIVPLAFMRGRTLNDAMVILDEAQNATRSQMLMFLTRMGHGSKMIVTGDTSQTDLDDPNESGLVDAARRLRRVRGVAFVTLMKSDIVRHNLVQRIVEAYAPPEEGPAREHFEK